MILEIVTPEATLVKGKVSIVTLPGANGNFQILNNHAPIVSTLEKGNVVFKAEDSLDFSKEFQSKFKTDDKGYSLAINGGVVELNNNKITVLAETE